MGGMKGSVLVIPTAFKRWGELTHPPATSGAVIRAVPREGTDEAKASPAVRDAAAERKDEGRDKAGTGGRHRTVRDHTVPRTSLAPTFRIVCVSLCYFERVFKENECQWNKSNHEHSEPRPRH